MTTARQLPSTKWGHMWHIVYLSYESGPQGRNYIGKHSTSELDDGYRGSYKDRLFKPEDRIILGYYKTAEAALAAEIQWQRVFRVAEDPSFANRAYQTSSRFRIVKHSEESKIKMKTAERRVNPNSLKSALGKSWFYNPCNGEELLRKECPEGFLPGRPSLSIENPAKNPTPETRLKMSEAQRKIPSEDRYWFGKEGNAKDTYWWHNPHTGECKRSKEQPALNWKRGKNDSK